MVKFCKCTLYIIMINASQDSSPTCSEVHIHHTLGSPKLTTFSSDGSKSSVNKGTPIVHSVHGWIRLRRRCVRLIGRGSKFLVNPAHIQEWKHEPSIRLVISTTAVVPLHYLFFNTVLAESVNWMSHFLRVELEVSVFEPSDCLPWTRFTQDWVNWIPFLFPDHISPFFHSTMHVSLMP